ncbi:hypothetical protein KUTeg_023230 [Tegillarca granosa]|uniref:SCP domain-containing protein n=1 Tax=Tegillarca granosa TaxID=220873 RepID=A0ABQ9E6T1_TEGGR|nr:hypothetical protein KUTeg_023230 [Tegillarca granosa]
MQSKMIQFFILLFLCGLISSDELEGEIRKSRHKRSTICSPIYSFNSDHSACIARSSLLVSSGVTDAEKTLIYWSDDIAFVAQSWAENCVFSHDLNWNRLIPGKYNLGQNLAKSSVKSPWENMIRAWHNEVNDFTYAGDNSGKVVGHYTQLMSAKAHLIGCGYANCGTNGHIYACNYGPPGQTNNQPYTNGTSCAQCPSQCNDNLCDCNGKFDLLIYVTNITKIVENLQIALLLFLCFRHQLFCIIVIIICAKSGNVKKIIFYVYLIDIIFIHKYI